MTYNIVKGLDFVLEFCQINKSLTNIEKYTQYTWGHILEH